MFLASTTAIIFPGQGSQIVGMGMEIAQSYSEAQYVFEEVNESLKQNLSEIIFNGSFEELTLTTNAQPALMAVSMAIMAVLKKQISFTLKNNAKYCAGHSLGEYTALTAAESFDLEKAVKLLRIRGDAMQGALPAGEGAMAALIGVSINEAESLVELASQKEVCQIANDNTIGQIVVSGNKSAINRLISLAQEKGKKAIILPVSSAFHSSLMAPATKIMQEALAEVEIKQPTIPLIANITAQPTQSPEEIRELLVKQVENRVRWHESILFLLENGITHFIEIGAGKVLSGLVKKINSNVRITTINNLESLNNFMEEIKVS